MSAELPPALYRLVRGLVWYSPYLSDFYSHTGRPSVDPELLIRMLLVGYCLGIRSERRLCEEMHLNLAYHWFCRLDRGDRVSRITRPSRRTDMAASAPARPHQEGHTVRYLGVELEDALAIAEAVADLKDWAVFIDGPALPFSDWSITTTQHMNTDIAWTLCSLYVLIYASRFSRSLSAPACPRP